LSSWKALDLGINFFILQCTAGKMVRVTEQIVGRWFAQGKWLVRSRHLPRKVFGRRADGPNQRAVCRAYPPGGGGSLSAADDHIDLYQMPMCRLDPWEEIAGHEVSSSRAR